MDGIDPRTSNRKVLGIDIDIREHNRLALDQHPLRFKMEFIQGSSIDPNIVSTVQNISSNYKNILVSLDKIKCLHYVLGLL